MIVILVLEGKRLDSLFSLLLSRTTPGQSSMFHLTLNNPIIVFHDLIDIKVGDVMMWEDDILMFGLFLEFSFHIKRVI